MLICQIGISEEEKFPQESGQGKLMLAHLMEMTLFLWHRALMYDAGQQTPGESNSKSAIKSKYVEKMK